MFAEGGEGEGASECAACVGEGVADGDEFWGEGEGLWGVVEGWVGFGVENCGWVGV